MSVKERNAKNAGKKWVKNVHPKPRQEDNRMVENESVANQSAMGWAESIKWV